MITIGTTIGASFMISDLKLAVVVFLKSKNFLWIFFNNAYPVHLYKERYYGLFINWHNWAFVLVLAQEIWRAAMVTPHIRRGTSTTQCLTESCCLYHLKPLLPRSVDSTMRSSRPCDWTLAKMTVSIHVFLKYQTFLDNFNIVFFQLYFKLRRYFL